MSPSTNPSLGLVVLLLAAAPLAGCVGVGTPDSPESETTTTQVTDHSSTTDAAERTQETTDASTTETTVPEPTNATAKERAIASEEDRVERELNASSVSGGVGGYDDPRATVIGREDGAVRVRVSVPYSYSYDCNGNAGAADLSTEAIYRVSAESIQLVEIVEDVRLLC